MTSLDHAVFSPSSASRFIACPGSIAMIRDAETKFGKPETSEYALEGTQAHNYIDAIVKASKFKDWGSDDTVKIVENLEMRSHIQNYLVFLKQLVINFSKNNKAVATLHEQRVKFDDDVWGTLDFAVYSDKAAVLCDFKYGKGVEVGVEGNAQLLTYALALQKFTGKIFDTVHLFIYQPRTPGKPFARYDATKDELTAFGTTLLNAKNKALTILKGGATENHLVYGEHCKFCYAKKKQICPVYQKEMDSTALAVLDEKPLPSPAVTELTMQQRIAIRQRRKQIEEFMEDNDEILLKAALAGQTIPGYKLVRGKSNRKWIKDEAKVAAALKERGVHEPYTESLIGIGEAERKLLKGQTLEGLYEKPEGKLQLAPEDDKREAVTSECGLDLLTEI